MYGETFGAEKMVPVTSKYGHTVISFGIGVMKPVYDLYDQLHRGRRASPKQKFSADPLPARQERALLTSCRTSCSSSIMYSQQERYEAQLDKLGMLGARRLYLRLLPRRGGQQAASMGEVLSWAESSAVVYANSVLGARCNRNSGMLELMGSIAGCVPYFGLLTDDGRTRRLDSRDQDTKRSRRPQLLGSAIGMKVMEQVPYIKGLDKWLGTEITTTVTAYLKDFGAATASNGAVGLYHVENLTPEAKAAGRGPHPRGRAGLRHRRRRAGARQGELPRACGRTSGAKPKLCFIGCPHLTLGQLTELDGAASKTCPAGKRPDQGHGAYRLHSRPGHYQGVPENRIRQAGCERTGVILCYICPLMYMNNPLSGKMPVITCSNKLRTYTTARYYTEDEILNKITGGAC